MFRVLLCGRSDRSVEVCTRGQANESISDRYFLLFRLNWNENNIQS